jgi:hypothetical protein
MNYEANGFSSSVLNTVLFLNCLLWAKDGSVVLAASFIIHNAYFAFIGS